MTMRSAMLRTIGRAATAVLAAGALTVLATGAADAATVGAPAASAAAVGDLTCVTPTHNTLSFSPALTINPQTETLTSHSDLGPCVSLSQPAITSGTWTSVTPNVPGMTCLGLLGTNTGTHTITWNTGQTSTVSGNRVSNLVGATLVVTLTGTVTSGVFAGGTVVEQFVGVSTDLVACTLGLGSVSSIDSTLEFAIS